MNISRTIRLDPVNKWLFSRSEKEIYLVGGYLRDILLGKSPSDRDYVIRGSAQEMARETAKKFKGTYFQFISKGTHRVAMKRGGLIDFSELQGDLNKDLSRRDFTVNALAWSPSQGIIAPPSHLVDLKKRLIRAVSAENLEDDPLRILRAYRLGSQLSFALDNQTRQYLRHYAPCLHNTASERITDEIFKMLVHDNSFNYIELCHLDNVLSQVIPISRSNFVYFSCQYRRLNSLLSRLTHISNGRSIRRSLDSAFSQGMTRTGLLRLFLLLHGSKGISDMKDRHYKIHFGSLTVSSAIRKSINCLAQAEKLLSSRLSSRKLYEILIFCYPYVYEAACLIALHREGNTTQYFEKAGLVLRYREKPLLTGTDILQQLGIEEGPNVGRIIDTVNGMRFSGKLKDRQSALKWLKRNLT